MRLSRISFLKDGLSSGTAHGVQYGDDGNDHFPGTLQLLQILKI